MIGKEVKFEHLYFAQRAAIRKLERVNGWEATSIRANPLVTYDSTVNVTFDTGPRRLDYKAVLIDSVGWEVTSKDGLGFRILTEGEFDQAARIRGNGFAARLEDEERAAA